MASEFSRDMMVEGVPGSVAADQSNAKSDTMQLMKHYGLHRHFTGSASVVLFGGGMKRGFVYGETAAERPLLVTRDPVSIDDLHATIFTAHGDLAANGLRRRAPPVLRHKRRQGAAGAGAVRVNGRVQVVRQANSDASFNPEPTATADAMFRRRWLPVKQDAAAVGKKYHGPSSRDSLLAARRRRPRRNKKDHGRPIHRLTMIFILKQDRELASAVLSIQRRS